ncbi:hypothetical protein V1520DRAFT_323995 [Lipomyces starkeyi]
MSEYIAPEICIDCFGIVQGLWYTGSAAFPSIVSLDEHYGAAWCSGNRQYYSVRLQIIKEVDGLAVARNISKGDAVLLLDGERRENKKPRSNQYRITGRITGIDYG